MTSKKVSSNNIFLKIHPLLKLIISVAVSTIIAFSISPEVPQLITIILVWDVFALCYLILSWIVLFKRSVTQIRQMAKKDDGSVAYVFLLVVVSSFASLVTVLLLIVSHDDSLSQSGLYLPVAIAGILLSWVMVHSTYTFHYAHMFYNVDEKEEGKDAHGLEFPGNEKPDYIDFAYFSFVIGCTFQVSDVEISSPRIRRVALVHSLISFLLNTFVVALTINLIGGLAK